MGFLKQIKSFSKHYKGKEILLHTVPKYVYDRKYLEESLNQLINNTKEQEKVKDNYIPTIYIMKVMISKEAKMASLKEDKPMQKINFKVKFFTCNLYIF